MASQQVDNNPRNSTTMQRLVTTIVTTMATTTANRYPTTSNWVPVPVKRTSSSISVATTECPQVNSKRARLLGRTKQKRDRIVQELHITTENPIELEKMLEEINKRISYLQGASLRRPKAEQVSVHVLLTSYVLLTSCFCFCCFADIQTVGQRIC